MRSSVIETRTEDYITTARAKGLPNVARPAPARLPERAAADGHARSRINLGYVVAGRDHGRGRVQLAGPRDADRTRRSRPATTRSSRAIFLILAVTVVLANLGADIVYGVLDPRVRA